MTIFVTGSWLRECLRRVLPGGLLCLVFTLSATAADRALVADVQRELGTLGYQVGAADGIAGARTRSAIESYQARYGLQRNGRATPELLAHMRSLHQSVPALPALPDSQPPLPALPELPALPAKQAATRAPPPRALSGSPAGRVATPGNAVGVGVTTRASTLRSRPVKSTAPTARVAAGEQLAVLRLSGRWSQVRLASGAEGWMPVVDLDVTQNSASESDRAGEQAADQGGGGGKGFLRSVTGLLTPGKRKAPSSGGDTTIGIRGLGREDLANAAPDMDAVVALDAYGVDIAGARLHAREQALQARTFAYPPSPGPQAGAGPGREDNTFGAADP